MQGRKRYLTHHITGVYKKLIVKEIVKNFVYTISVYFVYRYEYRNNKINIYIILIYCTTGMYRMW